MSGFGIEVWLYGLGLRVFRLSHVLSYIYSGYMQNSWDIQGRGWSHQSPAPATETKQTYMGLGPNYRSQHEKHVRGTGIVIGKPP